MKEQEQTSPWQAFAPVVEDKAPPKIDLQQVSAIRRTTPQERLASWYIQCRLPLFLGLLLFVGLQLPSLYPPQIARLLAIVLPLYFVFHPLLGRRPSATPFRSILVFLSALSLGALALWPTEYILRYEELKTSHLSSHAWFWQSSLESVASLKSVVAILVVLLMSFGARYLERSHYWLEFENRYTRLRSMFSIAALALPPLGLLVVVLYLFLAPAQLTWVDKAKDIDPYQGAMKLREVERYTLSAEVFKILELKEPEVMIAHAKDISQEDFVLGLAEISRELEDPEFRPSREDIVVLSFVGNRTLLKGEPSLETAEFGLAMWSLSNRLKDGDTFWATNRLLDEHVVPFIFRANQAELEEWKSRIQRLKVFQADSSAVDALVCARLEQDYISSLESRPLTFFGVRVTDSSFRSWFQWLRWRAVLLDYSHRRELLRSQNKKITNDNVGSLKTSPWYWPSQDLYQAYGFLHHKLNPRHLDRQLRFLQTALLLREVRLDTGRYPAELPEFAPKRLQYEFFGDTAVLKKHRPEEDGGPIEWSLR